MDSLEIKKNFHNLIDSIDNESLLLNFYNLLKNKATSKDGLLWESLTRKQQEELYLAFDESEKPENLINHEVMRKKHKKWL